MFRPDKTPSLEITPKRPIRHATGLHRRLETRRSPQSFSPSPEPKTLSEDTAEIFPPSEAAEETGLIELRKKEIKKAWQAELKTLTAKHKEPGTYEHASVRSAFMWSGAGRRLLEQVSSHFQGEALAEDKDQQRRQAYIKSLRVRLDNLENGSLKVSLTPEDRERLLQAQEPSSHDLEEA